jgi:hypothetical protein
MSQKFNEIQQRYLLCLYSVFGINIVFKVTKVKGYSPLTAYFVALCNMEIMMQILLVF